MASWRAAAVAAAFAWSVCRAAYHSRPEVAASTTAATRTRAASSHTCLGVMCRAFGPVRGLVSVLGSGAGSRSVAVTALPAWVVNVVIEQPPS